MTSRAIKKTGLSEKMKKASENPTPIKKQQTPDREEEKGENQQMSRTAEVFGVQSYRQRWEKVPTAWEGGHTGDGCQSSVHHERQRQQARYGGSRRQVPRGLQSLYRRGSTVSPIRARNWCRHQNQPHQSPDSVPLSSCLHQSTDGLHQPGVRS